MPLGKQLAMVREPRIAVALAITFFWILGYSIAYTYISPYLLDVTGMSERMVSTALLAFGVASLVGSKVGGFSTDRWGVARTLVGGMLFHTAALILLSVVGGTPAVAFTLMMLWAFFAWSSGPTQQYYLITLAPAASGIMLSLNTSVLQLAMASGAGLGGLVVNGLSLKAITWFGAVSVAVAAVTAAAALGLTAVRTRREAKLRSRGEAAVRAVR